jgi:hypothetical protein
MDRAETIKILTMLKTIYPNFVIPADKDERQVQVSVWQELFKDEAFALVSQAVTALMCSLKFPPTPADIKGKIAMLTRPAAMSEMEAWQLIRQAVDDCTTYAEIEGDQIIPASVINRRVFNRLPPILRRIVGSPSQLVEWQAMDTGIFGSVVQSNFARSYTALVRHEDEVARLPESARAMMLSGEVKQLAEVQE